MFKNTSLENNTVSSISKPTFNTPDLEKSGQKQSAMAKK